MKFMMMLILPAFLLVLCALPLRSIGKPSPDDNMARMGLMADTSMPSRLGSVSFNISCKPQVKAEFNRGIALLHAFWLDEAGKSFGNVAAADPDCAMAYWGVAMADFNQVNGGPTDTGVVAANRALRMADKAREKDPREVAYIHAVHLFFDGYRWCTRTAVEVARLRNLPRRAASPTGDRFGRRSNSGRHTETDHERCASGRAG